MSRDKHYIAVDKDEVMRCTWCGSTESKHWIRGKSRGIYCSSTCENADDVIGNYCFSIICSAGFVLIFLSFLLSFDIGSILVIGGIGFIGFISFLVVLGLVPIALGLRKISIISKARTEVPKDSKDFDEVFDERYLQCEKCGASLEVIDGAIPVKCSYCGFVNRVSYG